MVLRIDIDRWFRYGGHFESKMTAKIQNSFDLDEIWRHFGLQKAAIGNQMVAIWCSMSYFL
jgi:hypothetical protein